MDSEMIIIRSYSDVRTYCFLVYRWYIYEHRKHSFGLNYFCKLIIIFKLWIFFYLNRYDYCSINSVLIGFWKWGVNLTIFKGGQVLSSLRNIISVRQYSIVPISLQLPIKKKPSKKTHKTANWYLVINYY